MTGRKRALWAGGVVLVAALAGGLWYFRRDEAPDLPPPASPEEIARLEKEREALRVRIAELVAGDPVLKGMPAGNVVVGMPVAAATNLVQEVTTGFLDEVELVLKNIKVHKDGDITVKKGLLSLTPGHYVLDLNVDEAHALLKPGTPKVSFEKSRFGVALPVRLAKGEGRTTLNFEWDSQSIAGVLCDDFTVKQSLTGSVPPRSYAVKGSFLLEVNGGRLVASPRFPDPGLVVDVSVEPSEEAWRFLDRVVEERPAGCKAILKTIDMRKILSGILGKGFKVTVPSKVFKPVELPAGLQQEVTVEGKTYELRMTPTQLKLTPDVLWYGTEVEVAADKEDISASPTPSPTPTPAAKKPAP